MIGSRTRRRGIVAALATAVTATSLALTAPMAASAQAPEVTTAVNADEASALNGYRNVGYFTQWGVYGRDFQAKQLDVSGVAEDLTHINYAFGNIHYQSLECFIANKAQGTGPNGSDGAGDAWADFGMGYTEANSVAGVADTWDQPLAGSFNQLKQLKQKNPDLKVMLSLGGWTWSKNFSAAAATPQSRQNFVESCIDIYIKGNLPVIDGRGGPGAAAGVFDGFDLDWEWPGSLNGEVGNIVDAENDAANFKALIHEFRTQLDALSTTTGKQYQLSAFLPANVADIEAGGWNDPEIFEDLDFGNLQGYDLHGAWDPTLTGHQGNLYSDPADPRPADRSFSIDQALQSYLGAGIDSSQIGLGLAMYGRGWTGASSSDAWGSATGPAPGTWEAGIENYDDLKDRGTEYFDSAVGAAWVHDGNTWWSYDNPQSVAQKADYIVDNNLGGGMWWDLSGDRHGELTTVLSDALRAAPPGDATDPTNPTDPTDPTDPGDCSAAAWDASAVYTGGDSVSYEGVEYTAQWWTQGDTPGASSVWELNATCDGADPTDPTDPTDPSDPTDPTDPGDCSAAAWDAAAAYTGGDTVSYDGSEYTAKWWSQGETPGSQQWGAWEMVGACA